MNPILIAAALAGGTLGMAFPPRRSTRDELAMIGPTEPPPTPNNPPDYDKPFSPMEAAGHIMELKTAKVPPFGVPWQRYINKRVMTGTRPQEKARGKRRAHRKQANASRRRNR